MSRSPTIMEELLKRRCCVHGYHVKIEQNTHMYGTYAHVCALKFRTANISLFLLFRVENTS